MKLLSFLGQPSQFERDSHKEGQEFLKGNELVGFWGGGEDGILFLFLSLVSPVFLSFPHVISTNNHLFIH